MKFVRPLSTLGEEIRRRSEKIHTGISGVDKYLNGIRVGELTMLAGLPHHGKSLLALTTIHNNPRLPVLWVSPDESRAKVMGQLAAMAMGVNYAEDLEPVLESRTKNDHPTEAALDLSDEIQDTIRSRFPYFTVVGGERLSVTDIGVAMDEAEEICGMKPKMVVFDYLRQLTVPPNCDVPGWRSEALKAFGAKTDTAMVVINQVKRVFREALEPHSDLLSYEGERESFQIVWCTRRALIEPQSYGGVPEDRQPKVTIFVLKNKNGKLILQGHDCAINHRSGLIEEWEPNHDRRRRALPPL